MRKLIKDKRGVMEQLGGVAKGLAGFLIIIVVAFLVMANVYDQQHTLAGGNRAGCNATARTTCSIGENATRALQTQADTIPGWVGILVIVTIGGLVFAILKKSL